MRRTGCGTIPLVPVAERSVGEASAGFLAAIDLALKVDEGDRPQSVAAWRAALGGEPRDTAKKPRPVVKPRKGSPAEIPEARKGR